MADPATVADRAIAHCSTRSGLPWWPGITTEPAPGQASPAPAGRRVVVAGRFWSYGVLLIIGHDDGYHILLSGMSRLKVGGGQRVGAGDPVATFGNFSATSAQLYVELRRNGQLVDPLLRLAAGDSKVSG